MRQIENDRLTGERDRLDEKCVELTKENEELTQMKVGVSKEKRILSTYTRINSSRMLKVSNANKGN